VAWVRFHRWDAAAARLIGAAPPGDARVKQRLGNAQADAPVMIDQFESCS
jgi:hypothetical protein